MLKEAFILNEIGPYFYIADENGIGQYNGIQAYMILVKNPESCLKIALLHSLIGQGPMELAEPQKNDLP